MQIIVKQSYNHINTAFKNWNTPRGRYIRNKDEYERAMKEEGMVTYEEAQERSCKNLKEYKITKEAQEILRAAKSCAKSNGTINLKDRPKLIEKMIKHGSIKKNIDYSNMLPSHYQPKGGFNGNTK